MKSPGIKIRLLVGVFLLICMTTLSLDLVSIQITKKFMNKRFHDRINFLARYLAQNAEVGILIGDLAGLERLAFNLLDEQDVARVNIIDSNQKTLVDLSREVAQPLFQIEAPVIFQKADTETILFQSGNQKSNGSPDTQPEEPIGTVRITFSTHGIDALMIKITKQFIWVSLGLVVVASIVFYFLSSSIVHEIIRFADTARQIGRGDFELRAGKGKLPETQELALAFNLMLDSLAQSQNALERVTQEMIHQKTLAEMGKFAMMIAHEVKNPLSIIKSSIDILKKDETSTASATMVSYIEDEVRRLNRLIEDFLLFSKPVKPNLHEVDLNDMVRECILRFELQIATLPIVIKQDIPDEPCLVFADMDLLNRALGNIIKNAIEANEEQGTIEISVSMDKKTWIVKIEDQGDGIDPENQGKIFEPFFTTRSKGTGLGLAFTQQVVKNHAGIISVDRRKSGGSIFCIKLPIRSNITNLQEKNDQEIT